MHYELCIITTLALIFYLADRRGRRSLHFAQFPAYSPHKCHTLFCCHLQACGLRLLLTFRLAKLDCPTRVCQVGYNNIFEVFLCVFYLKIRILTFKYARIDFFNRTLPFNVESVSRYIKKYRRFST